MPPVRLLSRFTPPRPHQWRSYDRHRLRGEGGPHDNADAGGGGVRQSRRLGGGGDRGEAFGWQQGRTHSVGGWCGHGVGEAGTGVGRRRQRRYSSGRSVRALWRTRLGVGRWRGLSRGAKTAWPLPAGLQSVRRRCSRERRGLWRRRLDVSPGDGAPGVAGHSCFSVAAAASLANATRLGRRRQYRSAAAAAAPSPRGDRWRRWDRRRLRDGGGGGVPGTTRTAAAGNVVIVAATTAVVAAVEAAASVMHMRCRLLSVPAAAARHAVPAANDDM